MFVHNVLRYCLGGVDDTTINVLINSYVHYMQYNYCT